MLREERHLDAVRSSSQGAHDLALDAALLELLRLAAPVLAEGDDRVEAIASAVRACCHAQVAVSVAARAMQRPTTATSPTLSAMRIHAGFASRGASRKATPAAQTRATVDAYERAAGACEQCEARCEACAARLTGALEILRLDLACVASEAPSGRSMVDRLKLVAAAAPAIQSTASGKQRHHRHATSSPLAATARTHQVSGAGADAVAARHVEWGDARDALRVARETLHDERDLLMMQIKMAATATTVTAPAAATTPRRQSQSSSPQRVSRLGLGRTPLSAGAAARRNPHTSNRPRRHTAARRSPAPAPATRPDTTPSTPASAGAGAARVSPNRSATAASAAEVKGGDAASVETTLLRPLQARRARAIEADRLRDDAASMQRGRHREAMRTASATVSEVPTGDNAGATQQQHQQHQQQQKLKQQLDTINAALDAEKVRSERLAAQNIAILTKQQSDLAASSAALREERARNATLQGKLAASSTASSPAAPSRCAQMFPTPTTPHRSTTPRPAAPQPSPVEKALRSQNAALLRQQERDAAEREELLQRLQLASTPSPRSNDDGQLKLEATMARASELEHQLRVHATQLAQQERERVAAGVLARQEKQRAKVAMSEQQAAHAEELRVRVAEAVVASQSDDASAQLARTEMELLKQVLEGERNAMRVVEEERNHAKQQLSEERHAAEAAAALHERELDRTRLLLTEERKVTQRLIAQHRPTVNVSLQAACALLLLAHRTLTSLCPFSLITSAPSVRSLFRKVRQRTPLTRSLTTCALTLRSVSSSKRSAASYAPQVSSRRTLHIRRSRWCRSRSASARRSRRRYEARAWYTNRGAAAGAGALAAGAPLLRHMNANESNGGCPQRTRQASRRVTARRTTVARAKRSSRLRQRRRATLQPKSPPCRRSSTLRSDRLRTRCATHCRSRCSPPRRHRCDGHREARISSRRSDSSHHELLIQNRVVRVYWGGSRRVLRWGRGASRRGQVRRARCARSSPRSTQRAQASRGRRTKCAPHQRPRACERNEVKE